MLHEFLAADIVVVGAPIHNLAVASQRKARIDRRAVAGKTFRHTAEGPVGLACGKTVVVACSRGGLYRPGTQAAVWEHPWSDFSAIFGFAG